MRSALAALLVLASPAGAEVRHGRFAAPSLGREVAYAVQLPPSYAKGEKRYPVLYALHGLFESHEFWEKRGLAGVLDGLWARGEVPEFLAVAVDGGSSFFVNAPGGRYEDLVARDIVAHVESTYRVVRGREARALIGVSMGGYAALRIALARPEVFGAVAAHSAMLLLKAPTPEEGAGRWHMAAFRAVFGDPIDAALWAASDPLVWAERADPREVPALRFDCGSEDRYGLFAGNAELDRRLTARGVRHSFALLPGDHGYEYVRSVVDRSLRFVGDAFRAREAAASSLDAGRIASYSIRMATTVHLPPDLLEQVDRRAGDLGMSRNRYIRKALEQALRSETAWSGRFLDMLKEAGEDREGQRAVDEMRRAIASRRSRKKPPAL